MSVLRHRTRSDDCQARQMPLGLGASSCPEGALISDESDDSNRLAVVYEHGETPPKITITEADGNLQMVCADGIAVAIVACASGPSLSVSDVVLVERFGGAPQQ